MAAYPYLLQQPEAPINEKWLWLSDEITADDGTEQRISLTSLPKRSFSGNLLFTDSASIRQHIITLQAQLRSNFDWPAWHSLVVNKAAIVPGALTIFCNPRRSNFRVGGKILIVEGAKYEQRIVNTILADRITVTVALTNSYSQRAVVMPIVNVYSAGSAAVSRRAHNGHATGSFSFTETLPLDPFIAEDDKVELEMFDGLPVLNRRPRGDDYAQTLITGMEVTDYGAKAYLRTPWLEPQWTQPYYFLSDRLFEPEDWYFWQTFADYCRGSTNPFYLPQYRDDLNIKTPVVAGAGQVILKDTEYSQNYWPFSNYHKIMFHNEAGEQHFATVTSVNAILGEDRVNFEPVLPAGDWSEQSIGFVLKCRISDDTVSASHTGQTSEVTLNVRTVLE